MKNNDLVIVRGGGDLATGVIQKFYRAGVPLLVLEIPKPTTIRTNVSLSTAIYDGISQVEDVVCKRIDNASDWKSCYNNGQVPILVDTSGDSIRDLKPVCVVDAIIAKKNMGTNMSMAPITIALGPGFYSGKDVNAVIETMRGHNLGRLIFDGAAMPNTGVPGEIGGKSAQRVIHAANSGEVTPHFKIGQIVKENECVLTVGGTQMYAPFTGLLRGMIREGMNVPKGMKIADIDPRVDTNWHTISDKARCLGGSALEAYFYLKRKL